MSRVSDISAQSLYDLLPRLWHHIGPRRRSQFGLLLLLMIAASIAEIASIGAVLPFLGALIAPEKVFFHPYAQPFFPMTLIHEPSQMLLPLTAVFILIALFSAAMRVILLWAQTRIAYAIGADFGIQIYKKTLYQSYAMHVAQNSSAVIAGISIKANSVVGGAVLPILTIVSSSMILISVLLVIIAIDPVVALAAIVGLGAPYAFIVLATKKRLRLNGERINLESNHVIKALQEGLGGIRDILIDGTQDIFCKIYRDADLSLRRSQANIQIIGGAPRFIVEFVGMALIAIVAFGLAGRKDGIAGAIPVLGAVALCAQRLMPILQQIYISFTGIRGGQASLQDVLALLDQPLPGNVDIDKPIPIPFNQSIRLDQVSFRYEEGEPDVLQAVNLEISKGSRIGFMGTTGSGKSTLLDLIMGLLQPTQGLIAIDGMPITKLNNRAWQANIAHVPQVIFLADASITSNIAFGIPLENVDHNRVRSAAIQAQMASTIEIWDKKYDTFVGERGIRLSGGQRQRIGIARALYKQSSVIVFDEATSALDNDTENAVMEAIDMIGKDITILIVAHRLSTLKSCDQIIELSNGRVQRIGTYQEMVLSE